MQEDLKNLICSVNHNFLKYTQLWKTDNLYNKINLKKKISYRFKKRTEAFRYSLCLPRLFIKKID